MLHGVVTVTYERALKPAMMQMQATRTLASTPVLRRDAVMVMSEQVLRNVMTATTMTVTLVETTARPVVTTI